MSTLPFETDVEHNGSIKIQRVATLPAHGGASDEGRIIYAEDTELMYVGSSSDWTEFGTGGDIQQEFLTDPEPIILPTGPDVSPVTFDISTIATIPSWATTVILRGRVGVDHNQSAALFINEQTVSLAELVSGNGDMQDTNTESFEFTSGTNIKYQFTDNPKSGKSGLWLVGFQGSGSGSGSSGVSGGGTLIAYGEILDYGDVEGAPTGPLTVNGDFTAVKTNPGDGSVVVATFNTPLPNTNYNLVFEIDSDSVGLSTDMGVGFPIVQDKTASGFTFVVDDGLAFVQDLQINVRIESNIPNLATDMEYVRVTGTNQANDGGTTGDESSISHTHVANSGAFNRTYNYDLTQLIGTGFVANRVRYVHLEVFTRALNNASGGFSHLKADYPNSGGQRIIAGGTSVATDSTDNMTSHSIIAVPINPGQTLLNLEVDMSDSGGEDSNCNFTIIGVSQVFPVLSATSDTLLIKGTTNASGNNYIDSSSVVSTIVGAQEVWTSYGSPAINAVDWSDAFPISVPITYTKTSINCVLYDTTGATNASNENTATIELYIDWSAGTVKGHWMICFGTPFAHQKGGYFDGLIDATVIATGVNHGTSGFANIPQITTSGRMITQLPAINEFGNIAYTIKNFN
jgi:hypothetical protein